MLDYICRHWIGVVIIMVITLFIFWAIGFFANSLMGAKFELNSCWAGVAAISTAGIVGLGKYYTDSRHNSEPNKPIDGGG